MGGLGPHVQSLRCIVEQPAGSGRSQARYQHFERSRPNLSMREWQARNRLGLDKLERQPQRGLRMRQFVRSTTIRGRGVSNVDAANHEAPSAKGPFTSFNQGADGSVDNFKRRRATELKHGRIAPRRDPRVQLFRALGLAG